ncbi:MAG TPA: hypothetical protein VN238_03300, partial [Solirubrobacteraceae bacterium]|nr:hypothetical protein [Solirubrobacteraceae bacterium]
REYVDGGAWSFSNLDAAPAGRDTEVLCLNPATVSLEVARRSAFFAARAAFAASAEIEAMALRARAAQVRVVGPDVTAADEMGSNFMATGPAPAVHAAGYAQGRRLAATAGA